MVQYRRVTLTRHYQGRHSLIYGGGYEEQPCRTSRQDPMFERSLDWLVILVLALCLTTGAVTVGAVSVHEAESTDRSTEVGVSDSTPGEPEVLSGGFPNGVGTASLIAQQDAEDEPADNETTRHEHPDRTDGDGDSSAYADWLSNELSGALGQSTVELSQGQYDRARSILGDDYDDRLEQYAEVSDEVETGNGDPEEDTDEPTDPVEEFQESQENQREFVDSVEGYRETYEEYQEAREAGDEDRALRLARELEEFAERTNESSSRVVNNYANVSTHSDRDLEEETEAVVEIDEEISDQQEEVREREFEQTEIVADVVTPEASFLEPLVVSGTVTTADGQPVDDGQIAVEADGRVTMTPVTDGTYQLEYRPALLPENATTAPVTYVPGDDSVYLQSETEVPIDPERTQPTVAITNVTEAASYGEEVTVEGQVLVDDTPADQVPVGASFENQEVTALNSTDENGSFTTEVLVPKDVPAGESQLQISYPLVDRTLQSTTVEQPIEIDETDTELSVDASINDSGAVDVSGVLETTDGEPLDNQSIQLSMGDQRMEIAETDEDGVFETRLEVPDDIGSGTVDLVATYEDAETNLADSRAVLQLSFADRWGFQIGPQLYWAIAGVLLIVLGVTVLTTRSWGRSQAVLPSIFYGSNATESTDVSSEEDHEDSVDDAGEHDDATGDEVSGTRSTTPLPGTVARRILQSGDTDAATAAAYALTRRRIADDTESDPSNTHWEFYDVWRESRDGTGTASLEQLTELYERAAYAPVSVSEREATEAIELATELVSHEGHQISDS